MCYYIQTFTFTPISLDVLVLQLFKGKVMHVMKAYVEVAI
jgi:hypothetical protein